ncbi:hypothetical protein JEQ12_002256 [Ovis aries]|uniref:ABC transmembrane type-1 domain-containing protein n=1 Tax=Ovis aries TaxID=9940 RepID=A0A836A2S4_SHEEP|nr:hypothetical protein JEQ12_002256 [Ovis aries]
MGKPNPLQDANFCSCLFFCWLNPLFKIGYKQRLEEDDMYSVLLEDRSQHLGEELQGMTHGLSVVPRQCSDQPQCRYSWQHQWEEAGPYQSRGAYGYAAGLSACVLVWAVLHHLYFYRIQRVGMRLRVAVCHMIYRKVFCLSSSAMGKTTTGQIVNLLSNDVNRFDQIFLPVLLVGFSLAGSVLPQNSVIWGNDVLALSVGGATAGNCSDCPALDGNRNIVSCWDGGSHFPSAVAKLLWDVVCITPRNEFGINFFAVTKIMIFVTFATNVAFNKVITASQVFVVVTLYEALRFTSTLYFPMAIKKVSQAIVSIRRIKNFLLLDEISQLNTQLRSDDKTIVYMKDFTAFWDKESETPTLQGLSFTVRPGELLAVVGPVGAGKSSLLHALLGELPPSQGQVSVHGRIVYVSQQPWVFSGTVRSNILFGKKYEEERYEKVIKACALEEDLQLLKENDLTKIGDRGTPLSEGQKARVRPRQSCVSGCRHLPPGRSLSTVDVGVSRHLFEQMMCFQFGVTPTNVHLRSITFYIELMLFMSYEDQSKDL